MPGQRIERISEEIRKEISNIIKNNVKDPRISDFISIIRVETTRDLKHAKIFISVLGTKEEQSNTFYGLEKASGYIRKELAKRINLRYIPELHFIHDNSIEYSMHIEQKLREIIPAQEED